MDESRSTIDTLRKSVENTDSINKQLSGENRQCNLDLEASRKETTTCSGINIELNIRINALNEKYSCCQNESHQYTLQILTLRSESDNYNKKWSICQDDTFSLTKSLETCKANDDADSTKIKEEMAALRATEGLLKQCNDRRTELDRSYENEKKTVAELTISIRDIRIELNESTNKYNSQITLLTTNINQLEASLKSEKDEVNRLTINITEIQIRLDISIKVRTRL